MAFFKESLAVKGTRVAASWAFGSIKGYFRERAVVAGGRVPLDALVGSVALLGSAFLTAQRGGAPSLGASMLEAVGDAGVQSYAGTMGAGRFAKASGAIVATTQKRPLQPATTTVRGIGGSSFLSPTQLGYYARRR